MSARATFGDWLRDTRESHGYSQSQLANDTDMNRTYIVNLENTPTWPKPETRARFHAVFRTTDDDIERYGAARKRERPLPNGRVRVTYEPVVRRGDAPPVAVGDLPPALAELIKSIEWTEENVEAITPFLKRIARADAQEPTPSPDTPARTPREAPASDRAKRGS